MRGLGVAVVAVLGLPLAGCLGVTIPPKELPEWAVQPQAEATAPAPQRTVRRQAPRTTAQRRAPDQTAAVSYVAPATNSSGTKPLSSAETMPFTPEWTARENALDDRLRRSMNICGGC
jgi:hypothetical protein